MKFQVMLFSMIVAYAAADCPMQNTKNQCNSDPTGCGWQGGDCKSCAMTTVKARCDQSMYCEWNMDEGVCIKPVEPPKECKTFDSMEECGMEEGCHWKKKKKVCVRDKECEEIRSKRVCKKRDQCELKGKRCMTKMT